MNSWGQTCISRPAKHEQTGSIGASRRPAKYFNRRGQTCKVLQPTGSDLQSTSTNGVRPAKHFKTRKALHSLCNAHKMQKSYGI
ncbi:hypothetical protein [Acidaminobacter sp.]|uniref:hypothetical protein n=1 Tax=Acidaminobacter sp. TaxID=1872102 RepID=UPI00138244BD|nr:hypothetical protein [Acidaminobacter sp.]MDK9712085.1 hypothetical protein [Acidaminobacter sp.]MZQ97567.1 hypothetical protein [Acidaminobacter sp.]